MPQIGSTQLVRKLGSQESFKWDRCLCQYDASQTDSLNHENTLFCVTRQDALIGILARLRRGKTELRVFSYRRNHVQLRWSAGHFLTAPFHSMCCQGIGLVLDDHGHFSNGQLMFIMRNQLWFKLTGAFALIIFIGVVVTVWLTSQGAATQFEHFMVADQMVRPATQFACRRRWPATTQSSGGWDGLDAVFDRLIVDASDGLMTGMVGNMMGMHENRIQVLDLRAAVVADSAGRRAARR
jgi:hypothetical protein